MTNDNPELIELLEIEFERLVDLPQDEQSKFLAEIGNADPELKERLTLWLASDSRREGFMEDPTIRKDGTTDEMVGAMVGPYKVLQHIGEGGYGNVYLAEQREPVSRRVALKVVKLGMDTRQVIARFEAERQALAMMDHPNIAKVLDAGATETGRPYFVMELVRGVPLTEYCDRCRLSPRDRLPLFIDVCRAVHHAHQKGIIHRDLKPSNILVTLHDGIPVPQVIDFGIAKATNFRLTEKTLFTNFQQFVGTPAYTSPEQMEMSGLDVDTRSDIYSLGVVLYELLTGTTPVQNDSLRMAAHAEIQRIILESETPPPSSRVSTLASERQLEVATDRSDSPGRLRTLLRGELDWIVMKALEKDRERRYPSANALQQDVQSFLADQPVSAVAPSVLYRFRKFARRHKPAIAMGAVILIGSFVSVWQAVRATYASHEAQAQSERAETGELSARRNLYIADMNVTRGALESGNMERAISILESHLPESGGPDLRHFEWYYFWDQAHRELFTLVADDNLEDKTKPDAIWDLALSGDGRLLASAGRNGIVRVWDLATKKQISRFSMPAAQFVWIDLSPDGRHVAASCRRLKNGASSPEIVIWNTEDNIEAHRFSIAPSTYASSPQFISDSLVAVGGSLGNLWFLDLVEKTTHPAEGHDGGIVGVDYTAAADRIVTTAQGDPLIHIWNPKSREHSQTIRLAGAVTRHLARISPSGKQLISTRLMDPNVSLFDIETGKKAGEIELVHPNQGTRFNFDGSLIVSSEIDGKVSVFQTSTLQELTHYYHRGHQLNEMILSRHGELILTAGDTGVIAGWPGSAPKRGSLPTGNKVVAVQHSPNGVYLALGFGDGSVQLWNAVEETRLHTIPAQVEDEGPFPSYQIDFFAFSPDSRQLAITHVNKIPDRAAQKQETRSVDIWSLGDLKKVHPLPHPDEPICVAWASNGGYLATGSASLIRIWDLRSNEVCRTLAGVGGVLCLAFSPDSRILVSECEGDRGFEVWDVETGQRVAVLSEHVEPAGDNYSVLFSPDGKLLATGGYDSRVILWDTRTWEMQRALLGQKGPIADLSFTPDGKRLASSSYDNRCVLWDVASGREVASFPGFAIDFAPDGNALAIGGELVPNAEPAQLRASATVRILRAKKLRAIERVRPAR